MEVIGTLIQLLDAQTGLGKNGLWKKQSFVVETNDKFPKKICIHAWNEAADMIEKLEPGTFLKVQFDVESREYNGKWYTDVKARKVEALVSPASNNEAEDNDLFAEPETDKQPLPF